MAKVKMKYVEIAAPVEESKKIFDFLQVKSVIELHETEQIDGISLLQTAPTVMQINKYSNTAETALKILNKYSPQKG